MSAKTISGAKIECPVTVMGSLEPPTEVSMSLMKVFQNKNGWKHPQLPLLTGDKKTADEYAYCLDFYLGGHEIKKFRHGKEVVFTVTSEGYYYYVGG